MRERSSSPVHLRILLQARQLGQFIQKKVLNVDVTSNFSSVIERLEKRTLNRLSEIAPHGKDTAHR